MLDTTVAYVAAYIAIAVGVFGGRAMLICSAPKWSLWQVFRTRPSTKRHRAETLNSFLGTFWPLLVLSELVAAALLLVVVLAAVCCGVLVYVGLLVNGCREFVRDKLRRA